MSEDLDLAAEIAALSRKITALTGKLTVMSNRVGHLDQEVQAAIRVYFMMDELPPRVRRPARKARPRNGLRRVK